MREHISVAEVANCVCMLRADVIGAIVLTDTTDDVIALENICDNKARIVYASLVKEVLECVYSRGYRGVCGFVSSSSDAARTDMFCPEAGSVRGMLLDFDTCDDAARVVAGMTWVRAYQLEGHRLLSAAILALCARQLAAVHPCAAPLPTENDLQSRSAALPGVFARLNAGAVIDEMLSILRTAKPRGVSAERVPTPTEWLTQVIAQSEPVKAERDSVFWRVRQWERENVEFPLLKSWRQREPFGILYDQRYWQPDVCRFCSGEVFTDGFCAFKLDLDNFKTVNTCLGHSGGDEAIMTASRIILRILGTKAEVYRRGGDEFVALAPGMRPEEARAHGETLRAVIENEFAAWGAARGMPLTPTASIGVLYAKAGAAVDQVIDTLDHAQQQAKATGKNRVEYAEIV